MADAPAQQFTALRPFIPKRVQPLLRSVRKRLSRPRYLVEPYRSVYPYTMVGPIRQANLVRLAKAIDAEGVPGAIVECGVCDGGTAALMAYASPQRPVHLFDSWQGLPETSAEDGEGGKKWTGSCVGSPRRVIKIMRKLGVDTNRLTFHRGWFKDTFPHADVSPVALLHLDADFYEPIRLCLEYWYPRMAPGGYIQFDDYESFVGCKKAVDEFVARHPGLEIQAFVEGRAKARFLKKPA